MGWICPILFHRQPSWRVHSHNRPLWNIEVLLVSPGHGMLTWWRQMISVTFYQIEEKSGKSSVSIIHVSVPEDKLFVVSGPPRVSGLGPYLNLWEETSTIERRRVGSDNLLPWGCTWPTREDSGNNSWSSHKTSHRILELLSIFRSGFVHLWRLNSRKSLL